MSEQERRDIRGEWLAARDEHFGSLDGEPTREWNVKPITLNREIKRPFGEDVPAEWELNVADWLATPPKPYVLFADLAPAANDD